MYTIYRVELVQNAAFPPVSPPTCMGGRGVGVEHFSRYLWFYYERLQPHTVDIMKLTS